MLFSLAKVGLCPPPPLSLSLTHFFHLLCPVHFFQGEECEGGEHSVFNSFRPYSAHLSLPPLGMVHSVEPALKYLPGSLSLSKAHST